ncbi:MAG: hypothetical protein HOV68_05465 [Streptomycetaceae bacterium]|nr:hypothetical protein [Streptomycetaceae bacterium]
MPTQDAGLPPERIGELLDHDTEYARLTLLRRGSFLPMAILYGADPDDAPVPMVLLGGLDPVTSILTDLCRQRRTAVVLFVEEAHLRPVAQPSERVEVLIATAVQAASGQATSRALRIVRTPDGRLVDAVPYLGDDAGGGVVAEGPSVEKLRAILASSA